MKCFTLAVLLAFAVAQPVQIIDGPVVVPPPPAPKPVEPALAPAPEGPALAPAPPAPAPNAPVAPLPVQQPEAPLVCMKALMHGDPAQVLATPSCEPVVKACSADFHRLCGAGHPHPFNVRVQRPDGAAPEHLVARGKRNPMRCMARNRRQWSPACNEAVSALGKAVLADSPCKADVEKYCVDEKCPRLCFKKHVKEFSAECHKWVGINIVLFAQEQDAPEQNDQNVVPPSHRGYRQHHHAFGLFFFLGFLLCTLCLCRACCRFRKGCKKNCQYPGNAQYSPLANDIELGDVVVAGREWSCPQCTLTNAASSSHCAACGGAATVAPVMASAPPAPTYIAPMAMPPVAMPPVSAAARPSLYPNIYAPALVQYRAPQ